MSKKTKFPNALRGVRLKDLLPRWNKNHFWAIGSDGFFYEVLVNAKGFTFRKLNNY